jgi:site-specific DNA-cytosine methylase
LSLDITAADHFCGAGGASIGLVAAGAVVTDAANHWRAACDIYERNNRDTRVHCADLSAVHPSRFPRTDIAWFSPECFPAGTLILTERGLVPIEEVRTGLYADRVLTHEGRWRLVTGATSRLAETLVVTGQGHPGLEVTGEHPFYVRRQHSATSRRPTSYDAPEWVAAEKLEGGKKSPYRWATPVEVEQLRIPPVESGGPWQGRGMPLDDPEFWWLVGRWLGDGTVRLRSGQGGEVTICAGDHEADELWERLQRWSPPTAERSTKLSGHLRWRRRRTRTAWLFETSHQELAEWLVLHFGRLAHGKTIPAWALSLNEQYRQALVEGYVSADGHDDGKTITIGTVSKGLAIATRLLVESLGFRTSLRRYADTTKTIEGRAVTVRDRYLLRWWKNGTQRAAFSEGGHAWSLVKSVTAGRELVEVFNISVEEDESYVADGIVVHNCRTFSISAPAEEGRMPTLFDESPDAEVTRSRVSMLDVIKFTDYHRYDVVMVENVVEVTRKFPIDWWYAEMVKLGYDFKVLSINSMVCWPTPQSRDRWYACFWRVGNRPPDFELRPPSWCPNCQADVEGYQWFKRPPVGDPRAQCGKYRQQYLFKCSRCHAQALPYVWPALSALDLSLPCPRIGDRDRPLAEATRRRIEVGLERYGPGAIVQAAGNTFERAGYYRTWPLWHPLMAQTGTLQHGVAVNTHQAGSPARYDGNRVSPLDWPLATQTGQMAMGLAVPLGHNSATSSSSARPLDYPGLTQTGRSEIALVVPLDHPGERGPRAAPADWPQRTQTGRAENMVVVVPMRTHNGPRRSGEPLAPLTTSHGGGHSLVEMPEEFMITLRNHADARSMGEPIPGLTADGNHHAVVDPGGGVMVRMNGGMDQAAAMATDWRDPMGTVTGAANQGVVPFLSHFYGHARPGYSDIRHPAPTQLGNDHTGVVEPVSITVDECGFRMMEPLEAKAAMAIPAGYEIVGSKRVMVKLCGQAVTPPVSGFISGRAIDSLAS